MVRKITGIGQPLLDYTVSVSESFFDKTGLIEGSWNKVDEKIMKKYCDTYAIKSLSKQPGGSAANTLMNLALLGVPSSFQGTIGGGEHGDLYKQLYGAEDFNPSLITTDLLQGICFVFVMPGGERTFVTHLGAAEEFSKENLDLKLIKEADYLHLESFLFTSEKSKEAVFDAVNVARNSGTLISLDLSAAEVIAEHKQDIEHLVNTYVHILVATEEEAKAFVPDAKYPVKEFLDMNKEVPYVIIKRGNKETLYQHQKQSYKFPTYAVKTRNTNGAGDAFFAGLLFGLANDYAPSRSVQAGNYFASKVVESLSTKPDEDFTLLKRTMGSMFGM